MNIDKDLTDEQYSFKTLENVLVTPLLGAAAELTYRGTPDTITAIEEWPE